ncbi:GNAT family N-acetyltransferase [Kitasatospora sp. NBC_01287]|uniref:GNAT family N-acetyltransferase n=1 Tax=Kitasatospora sp. NBC_01287 TaxID=2903573 RepID=UPI0022562C5D|nr:GNAT family N-acetyltransferase [Kitasatospora sp. NBC_01287]MCX4750693.1 GNAT family N-acetyltransferase [Kitasatospora sp. NBC_01287]
MTATARLRPARPQDVEPIAELRAVVLRTDLERLGRYDPDRVRQRLREGFAAEHTWVILAADGPAGGTGDQAGDGTGGPDAFAGCVALRPAADGHWLEHFYLDPARQGRGLGGAVLRELLAEADARGRTVRLNVLQGSPARRLYERFGFTTESEDAVDVWMVRHPG